MSLIPASLSRFATRALPHGMNPARDWALLLTVAGVLLLVIIGWSVWAFETVVGGGTLGTTAPAASPTASTSALDTIGAVLNARATEDANYVNGVYRFTDPAQ